MEISANSPAGTLTSDLQIEGVQTVTPITATNPHKTRQVLISNPVVNLGYVSRGCFNIILYYKKTSAGINDSGWFIAGWIKESLGIILAETPLLSGRLRRRENSNGDGGGGCEFEVVANDSGARLIEARIGRNLSEFVESNGGNDGGGGEEELVYWKEIDENNPQFCPLFYVQVTNFKCGGYSVGISCSLLLTDLLFTNFFKRWTQIHNNLLTPKNNLIIPHFYIPNLKQSTNKIKDIIIPTSNKKHGYTSILNVTFDEIINSDVNNLFKKLALFCFEKTETNKNIVSNVVFINNKHSSDRISIEIYSKQDIVEELKDNTSEDIFEIQLNDGKWSGLGVNEVEFCKGNKPIHVSYWNGSIVDGLVCCVPSVSNASSRVNMIVTIPNKN